MRAERIAGGRDLWEELLASTERASFFLTPRYARIAGRAYGASARSVTVVCEDGRRVGAVLLRGKAPPLRPLWLSPGRGLPGGLLADGPLAPAHVDALLRALAREPLTSFRFSFEPRTAPAPLPAPERSWMPGRVHVLELPGRFETLWRRAFTAKVRNQCRKARRLGLWVGIERSPEAFQEFAQLHARVSRAWAPSAREPASLFAACAEEAQAAGSALELWCARPGGSRGPLVAGALVAKRGDTWVYWLGAMDRGARAFCPSVALQRAILEAACRSGARRYLLGASGGIRSVESFKSSLGARAIDFAFGLEVRGRLRQLARRARSGLAARATRPPPSAAAQAFRTQA